MIPADRADAIVAEEFLWVQQVYEQTAQVIPTHHPHHRQHHDIFILACRILLALDQARDIGAVPYKPAHAFIDKRCGLLGWKRLHGQQWQQPDQRAHFQQYLAAIRRTNLIVEKAVFLVPEPDPTLGPPRR